jgi:hypothetical protein
MIRLAVTLIFLAGHLLLYVLLLRRLAPFSKERVIFWYHGMSFLLLPPALLVFIPSDKDAVASLVACVCLHGIYSLSFLELWSLSESGYSLSILGRIEKGEAAVSGNLDESIKQIGSVRKRARLAALERLGLVREVDGLFSLTAPGRAAAAALRLLRWTTNIQRIG